jgi:hypothetical protein
VRASLPSPSRTRRLDLTRPTFARSYILPDETGWYPIEDYNNVSACFAPSRGVGPMLNPFARFAFPAARKSIPVGWEPDADRLRGHIFTNDDNSTVILSLKGTSAGLLGSGGPTAKNVSGCAQQSAKRRPARRAGADVDWPLLLPHTHRIVSRTTCSCEFTYQNVLSTVLMN